MTKKTADTYAVTLKAPKGHVVPTLLAAVGEWLAEQPDGSVGYVEGFVAGKLPKDGWEQHAARVNAHGFVIATTADASSIVVLDKLPGMPVVCLGGEGDLFTIGDSLEAFLLRWSAGETGVMDLDDDECATGRTALATWLKKQKVKSPAVPELDFESWLDGKETTSTKSADAAVAALADIIGRSPDDAAVKAFLAAHSSKTATLEIELAVEKRRVTTIFLSPRKKGKKLYAGPMPYGIDLAMTRKAIAKAVGRRPDKGGEWDIWNEGKTDLRCEYDGAKVTSLIVMEPWKDDD